MSEFIKPSLIGQDWHHMNCYGCGPDNIKGMHLDFPFEEKTGEVRFIEKIEKYYEGAPGYVHGGVLASIFDEAQGVLCFHVGHFVMTDELKIKYKKACPLNEEIEFRAFVTAVRKRRLYTKATVTLVRTGELLAYSTARWYVLPERVFEKMFHRSPLATDRLKKIIEENQKRGKKIRKKFKEELKK